MAASAMVLHMSHECSSSHSLSLSLFVHVLQMPTVKTKVPCVILWSVCMFSYSFRGGPWRGRDRTAGLWHREGGTDRTTLTLAELQNAPQLIISKCVKSHAAHTHCLSMCEWVCVWCWVCVNPIYFANDANVDGSWCCQTEQWREMDRERERE